jgi:hypothetical protein
MQKWICLLMLAVPGTPAAAQAIYPENVRVMVGDDQRWSSPDFDDGNWQTIYWHDADPQQRLMWLRATLRIPGDAVAPGAEYRPVALYVSVLASYEVYWNGVRVGVNGTPAATPAGETPGRMDRRFDISPQLLRAGANVLALRMSSFHAHRKLSRPMHLLAVEAGTRTIESVLLGRALVSVAGGALLLGALYFGAMFLSDRRDRASLLLALLSLSVFAQLCAEMWRMYPYLYPVQVVRLEVILGCAVLSGILLMLYVLQRFPVPGRNVTFASVLAVVVAGILFVPGYDLKTAIAQLVPMTGALVVAARAWSTRRPGAAGMCIAIMLVLVSFFVAPGRFIDETYYFAAIALLLFLFAQQVLVLRRAQEERESARLRSMRLELELLKRQIQPHFLLNSLTAMSELLESDPRAGVRMIDALSAELRSLSLVSGQTTVPMATELDLCRAHLRVMGFRMERQFELVADRVDDSAPVPPGIFHTLIENAFTHNEYPRGATFVLEQAPGVERRRIYTLRSPLSGPAVVGGEGQGSAYVRARLREAFGDAGRFTSGVVAGEWQAVVEMPASA